MDIEIHIHTCLRTFTLRVPGRLFAEDLHDEHLRIMVDSFIEDLPEEMVIVPDYYEDPEGHREAMEKLERARQAENPSDNHKVEVRIPASNVVKSGITWGGFA